MEADTVEMVVVGGIGAGMLIGVVVLAVIYPEARNDLAAAFVPSIVFGFIGATAARR